MNILVTSLPDLRKINPQRPHHLLRFLKQKHHITIISGNAWWVEPHEDDFTNALLKNTDYYYLSDGAISPLIQEALAFRRMNSLSVNLHDFDLVISFHSLIAGYTLSKKGTMPMVLDICDDIVDWISNSSQIPSILKPAGKTAGSFFLKRALNHSKKVTYSIESLKEKYRVPEEKSVLIPNGVDTQLFRRVSDDGLREALQIPEGALVLGFVGYLGEWTNLEIVFETVRQLQRHMAVIMLVAGCGPKLEVYKSLVNELHISDKVRFLGNIPYTRVPQYISSMDICLLPFDSSAVSTNALPLKLFEYMACEKPVISTPLTGVQRAVGDIPFYFADSEELKDQLLNLYTYPEGCQKLGEKGRNFVESNFSWDNIGLAFTRVANSALEEDNGR